MMRWTAKRSVGRGHSRRGPGRANAKAADSSVRATRKWATAIALRVGMGSTLILILISMGCGYHRAGNAVELPQNIHSIAIPGFVSHSQTFRIEQLLTDNGRKRKPAEVYRKVIPGNAPALAAEDTDDVEAGVEEMAAK